MSYRALGFLDLQQTKQEALDTVTSANAQYTEALLNKLDVPAKYAGPLSTAEQQAFSVLLESGSAGKMPSPQQFKGIVSGLGTALAAGALATPCGPAAPLCGAAAGFVIGKLTDAVFGSGGSGCTINGVDCNQWIAEMRRRAVSSCPPGDETCKKDMMFMVDEWSTRRNIAYLRWVRYKNECVNWNNQPKATPQSALPDHCFPGCEGKGFLLKPACKNQSALVPPPLNTPSIEEIQSDIAKRAMVARYAAEYAFVKDVDTQSKAILSKIEPRCGASSACKSQVQGIMIEGVYQAAKELRSIGGRPGAAKIMQSARLQAEGAIAQSRAIQLQKEATDKVAASRASEQADSVSSQDTTRKVLLGVAAAAAVAAVFYAARSRR